jgi:hypothetical protein
VIVNDLLKLADGSPVLDPVSVAIDFTDVTFASLALFTQFALGGLSWSTWSA